MRAVVVLTLLLRVPGALQAMDCNQNGVKDMVDIESAASVDCNGNQVPDECEFSPLGFRLPVTNQSFPLDGVPKDITTGDLNGDGLPDLVAGVQDTTPTAFLRVLFNNGDRTFGPALDHDLGESVKAISVADLDRDGDPDVASIDGNAVTTLINRGDGTFTAMPPVPVTVGTRWLAVADLDGDEFPDLATVSRISDTVAVFINRGDGALSEAILFPTGGRPAGVVIVDMNGDGAMDIVTMNESSRDVSVLLNSGGATFATPVHHAVGSRPRVVVAVDLDGEGDVDIVVVVGSRVRIMENRGAGELSEAMDTAVGVGTIVTRLIATDLDGDGDADIALARAGLTRIFIFGNIGNGRFLPSTDVLIEGSAVHLVAADLDSDGDPELVTVATGLDGGSVLWNDNTDALALERTSAPRVGHRPHGGTSGDFNNDGLVDVVTANGSDRSITVFRSIGDGTLAEGVRVDTGGYLNSIAAGDVDGDGDLDLLMVDPKVNKLSVLRNTNGALQDLRLFPAGRECFMVTADDLDGDGDLDAVTANARGNDLSLLFNSGDGQYDGRVERVAAGSRPLAVAAADLDGDGDLDLAVANATSRDLSVIIGHGDGSFGATASYATPGAAFYVATADVDGDGDLDLLSANTKTFERVGVHLNGGNGDFSPGGGFNTAQTPYSLITADVNGDGVADVVTANQEPDTVSLLLGVGDGTFDRVFNVAVGQDPRFVVALDLDRDGDQDVVSANHTSRNLTVILNRTAESDFAEPFLETICTPLDFKKTSIPARTGGIVDRAAKYLLPARDDADLLPTLFQNISRFVLHQDFLTNVFPDLFPALPPAEYNRLVGLRATRQYFVGVIGRLRRATGIAYGFNVVTDDSEALTAEEVRGVFEKLKSSFRLEPLVYFPDTARARENAANWVNPDFPIITDDGTGDIDYEAYTNAVGYGRVRLLTRAELAEANETGQASFQNIFVLEEAPRDIEGVVAGVITAQPQGEQSHLAIRTARRGTPNAFVADAMAVFAPYEDTLVRLEVKPTTFEVTVATVEEAKAFWESSRPRLAELPRVDAEFTELSSLAEIAAMDLEESQEHRFGGKATNLSRLGRTLAGSPFEHYGEVGFAIPVHHYLEFLHTNTIPSALDPELEVTYAEYLVELLESPEFQSDSTLRFQALESFRDFARENGTVSEVLVENIHARIVDNFGSSALPVRFRSSSNVEDALEFNGAGLYESTAGCADDDLDADDRGPSRCDPSKDSERGVRRALRKVWTSVYTFRAFEERAFFGIPEDRVAMGILVSRAFPDELANGVAFTGNLANPLDRRFVVTAQLGEVSVVSPDPGVLPERDLLEVLDGEVVRILRPLRGSTLVEPGTWVLSDDHLEEMGRFLSFVDRNFPVNPGDHGREQILLDLEFKLEPDDSLAFKQIRPFLLSGPPPPTPAFALEIPAGGLTICGVFGVAGVTRGPLDEYLLKSKIHLRGGTTELPTSAISFPGDLFDEVLFGPEQEVAEPVAPGRFHVRRIPRSADITVYLFSHEQDFRLSDGRKLKLEIVSPLEFEGRGNDPVSPPLVLDDAFFTVLTGFEAIQGTLDGIPSVAYGSCTNESLPLLEVSTTLQDGSTIRLQERFAEAASLLDTAPASLVQAEVTLGGERRLVTDYFRLVYSAFRHNTGVRYWIVLDPPLSVRGIARAVHAVELMAPEARDDSAAQVNLLDASLDIIATPPVLTHHRGEIPDARNGLFQRGDVNDDGERNVTDVVRVLAYLFLRDPAPRCLKSADVDDSGGVNIADPVALLDFLFRDGPAPREPLDTCGTDPTDDALRCESSPRCDTN